VLENRNLVKNCTESKSKSSFRVGVDCPEAMEEIEPRIEEDNKLWLRTILA